jgi:ABC-2 type transport system permease protein
MLVGSIRSEFIKLLSTRLWWILALILAIYAAFTAALLGAAFGGLLTADSDVPVGLPDIHEPIYASAVTIGYVFPVILGTFCVTGEVRHQTLTPTFLATPRRGLVLTAKVIAAFVFGLIYGVIAFIGSIGGGAPLLALGDTSTALESQDTWMLVARGILAMGLWALVGVGIGSLIPNQIAAIVIIIAFTQFVEPTIRTVGAIVDWLSDIVKFLPGAASDALVGASIFSAMGGGGDLLEWWQGGLILAAIALAISLLGGLTAFRRDIT